jgi:hypothetical protein
MLRLAVALALAVAAVAVPSATAAPSMYDTRADLYASQPAEVAQAMRASGFEQQPAPSAGLVPGGVSVDWAYAAIGVAIGAGSMFVVRRARPALIA